MKKEYLEIIETTEQEIIHCNNPHHFRDKIIPNINVLMSDCINIAKFTEEKKEREEIFDFRYSLKQLRSRAQHKALQLARYSR